MHPLFRFSLDWHQRHHERHRPRGQREGSRVDGVSAGPAPDTALAGYGTPGDEPVRRHGRRGHVHGHAGHHGHHAHHHGHHGPHHGWLAHGLARLAIGRRPHGGRGEGGGGWGGGPDGFDGGDDGFRRGRKFSSEDLQLMLLSLLEEKPSHGYELIKALEVRTNGFYKPSPGMVYPALTWLEEVGFATVDTEGNKKRYHLADAGLAHLDTNRERLAMMQLKLRHAARKMDWVRRALAGEGGEIAEQRVDSDDAGAWLPEFVDARRGLKHALLLRTDATHDEQRRIAAILRDALNAIEAGKPGDGAVPAA